MLSSSTQIAYESFLASAAGPPRSLRYCTAVVFSAGRMGEAYLVDHQQHSGPSSSSTSSSSIQYVAQASQGIVTSWLNHLEQRRNRTTASPSSKKARRTSPQTRTTKSKSTNSSSSKALVVVPSKNKEAETGKSVEEEHEKEQQHGETLCGIFVRDPDLQQVPLAPISSSTTAASSHQQEEEDALQHNMFSFLTRSELDDLVAGKQQQHHHHHATSCPSSNCFWTGVLLIMDFPRSDFMFNLCECSWFAGKLASVSYRVSLRHLDDAAASLVEKCECCAYPGFSEEEDDHHHTHQQNNNNNSDKKKKQMMMTMQLDPHERLRISKTCTALSTPITRFCRELVGKSFTHVSGKFWLLFCPDEPRPKESTNYHDMMIREKKKKQQHDEEMLSSRRSGIINNHRASTADNDGQKKTKTSVDQQYMGNVQQMYTHATHIQQARALQKEKSRQRSNSPLRSSSSSSKGRSSNNPGEWYFLGAQAMQQSLRLTSAQALQERAQQRTAAGATAAAAAATTSSSSRSQQQPTPSNQQQHHREDDGGGIDDDDGGISWDAAGGAVSGASPIINSSVHASSPADVSVSNALVAVGHDNDNSHHHRDNNNNKLIVPAASSSSPLPTPEEMWENRLRAGGPRRAILTADMDHRMKKLHQFNAVSSPLPHHHHQHHHHSGSTSQGTIDTSQSPFLAITGAGHNNTSSPSLSHTHPHHRRQQQQQHPGGSGGACGAVLGGAGRANPDAVTSKRIANSRFLSRLSRFLDHEQDRVVQKEQQQQLEAEAERERIAAAEKEREAQKNAASSSSLAISASGIMLSPSIAIGNNRRIAANAIRQRSPVFVNQLEKIKYIYDVTGFYRMLETAHLELFSERLDVRHGSLEHDIVMANNNNNNSKNNKDGGGCAKRVVRVSSEAKAREATDFFSDLGVMAEYEVERPDEDEEMLMYDQELTSPMASLTSGGNQQHSSLLLQSPSSSSSAGAAAAAAADLQLNNSIMSDSALSGRAPFALVTIHIPENSRVASRILALTLFKAETLHKTIDKLARWQVETWWHMYTGGTATLHRCLGLVLFEKEPPETTSSFAASAGGGGGGGNNARRPSGGADSSPGGATNQQSLPTISITDQEAVEEAEAAAMRARAAKLLERQQFFTSEDNERSAIVVTETKHRFIVLNMEADHGGFLREVLPEWVASAAVNHYKHINYQDLPQNYSPSSASAAVSSPTAGGGGGSGSHGRRGRRAGAGGEDDGSDDVSPALSFISAVANDIAEEERIATEQKQREDEERQRLEAERKLEEEIARENDARRKAEALAVERQLFAQESLKGMPTDMTVEELREDGQWLQESLAVDLLKRAEFVARCGVLSAFSTNLASVCHAFGKILLAAAESADSSDSKTVSVMLKRFISSLRSRSSDDDPLVGVETQQQQQLQRRRSSRVVISSYSAAEVAILRRTYIFETLFTRESIARAEMEAFFAEAFALSAWTAAPTMAASRACVAQQRFRDARVLTHMCGEVVLLRSETSARGNIRTAAFEQMVTMLRWFSVVGGDGKNDFVVDVVEQEAKKDVTSSASSAVVLLSSKNKKKSEPSASDLRVRKEMLFVMAFERREVERRQQLVADAEEEITEGLIEFAKKKCVLLL